MLGYIAGALAWGFLKSWGNGAKRAHNSLADLGFSELLEEVEYRTVIERAGLRGSLGLSPLAARVATSCAFGLAHPGYMADAALGGMLYSKAYDRGGLPLAVGAHLAHNIGVFLGGK